MPIPIKKETNIYKECVHIELMIHRTLKIQDFKTLQQTLKTFYFGKVIAEEPMFTFKSQNSPFLASCLNVR